MGCRRGTSLVRPPCRSCWNSELGPPHQSAARFATRSRNLPLKQARKVGNSLCGNKGGARVRQPTSFSPTGRDNLAGSRPPRNRARSTARCIKTTASRIRQEDLKTCHLHQVSSASASSSLVQYFPRIERYHLLRRESRSRGGKSEFGLTIKPEMLAPDW